MFGIGIEWWILYALILVVALIALRSFMNGVRILQAELRDIQKDVKQLEASELLRELRAIKYILEGFESDYGGFVLKERIESTEHQE
jgi:hypothetical protein